MNEKPANISENIHQLNILIVEDNPGDMFLLEETLGMTRIPFGKVWKAHTATDAIKILGEHTVDVVLLDLSLPDSSGFNSYEQINEHASAIPIIVLTGLADMDLALETMASGGQDYLIKGEFDEHLLAKSIQYSIERNRIRESLRESNESYRNLFYNNPMPIFIWDLHTMDVLEVNEVAQKEYGYTRDEMLTMKITDFRPSTDHERTKAFAQEFLLSDVARKSAIWHQLRKNGELMVLDVSSHRIDYKGRTAILAIHNNITERVRLEEKLEEERLMKQKEITEATIRVQEKERYDISSELHDNVNQQLTVAMMYIASAQQRSPENTELLKQSSSFILNAIEEIRKLSQNLVTPLIKHFGLGKAAEGLLDDISAVNNFHIDFNADSFYEEDILYDFKLNLFRILQEVMNNIIKHAKASTVTITLTRDASFIHLAVVDDGVGFDTGKHKKGIGIYNIMSRADLYNAEAEIKSSPGNGCHITIRFPLTEDILVSED
ncbi:response regulator [Sediminibacterium soli]|uniref:response regulator n=1 Tax=Sediminibacterium soli TaxID=2698829 RepID=UPI00137ABABA|nr:response regulator [Sediminibacterium soli]NCI45179.1 response regulator [Sediminibacterium soli]